MREKGAGGRGASRMTEAGDDSVSPKDYAFPPLGRCDTRQRRHVGGTELAQPMDASLRGESVMKLRDLGGSLFGGSVVFALPHARCALVGAWGCP